MASICRHLKFILLKMCGNQGMKLIKLDSCEAETVVGYDLVSTASRCRKILLLYDRGGYRNKNLECEIHTDDFYIMGLCGLGSLGEKKI